MPHIERYWAEADPEYCDGEEAESFSTLLNRAKAALERLAAMPENALVYVSGMRSQCLRIFTSRSRAKAQSPPTELTGDPRG